MNKAYNLEKLQFLLVDDNKHMLTLTKSILNSLGAKHTIEAENGAEAFKELRHFPADIIICDWQMEPLDGIDFTRMVRTANDSPNPFVPIIMLTGHTQMRRITEARDAGVNEYLAKPISAHGLYSRIISIIERPRPFIRTGMFFGHSRRRQGSRHYKGSERRAPDD